MGAGDVVRGMGGSRGVAVEGQPSSDRVFSLRELVVESPLALAVVYVNSTVLTENLLLSTVCLYSSGVIEDYRRTYPCFVVALVVAPLCVVCGVSHVVQKLLLLSSGGLQVMHML